MPLFFAGLIAILFNKEYIIMNSELIIYLTFLSLVIIFITNLGPSLVILFDDIRNSLRESLILSLNTVIEVLRDKQLHAAMKFNAPFLYNKKKLLNIKDDLSINEQHSN